MAKLLRPASACLALVCLAGACAGPEGASPPDGGRPPAAAPRAGNGPAPSPPGPSPPAAGGEARALVSRRGVVLAVKGRDQRGYRVATPCSNTAVVAAGTPVTSAAVVLDPGHGGDEDGAMGPNGLTEKAVNLSVARRAQAALERQGHTAVLTRAGDYRMTLDARAELVQSLRPRAFVSVHHNSVPDGPSPGPGTETFHQLGSPESRRLAGLVYEEVVRALSAYRVAWVADRDAGAKYRQNSRGGDYYAILRQTRGVPAVLAELAYVSNPPEAELLARPEVQQVEAEAVARGVVRFLTTGDPGSGYVTPYPRNEPSGPGGGRSGCVDPPL